MASSWGHRVRPLPNPATTWTTPSWAPSGVWSGECSRCCRGRARHRREPEPAPAEWELEFRYITGRSGRVSSRRERICSGCLERMRANGVEVLEGAGPTRPTFEERQAAELEP